MHRDVWRRLSRLEYGRARTLLVLSEAVWSFHSLWSPERLLGLQKLAKRRGEDGFEIRLRNSTEGRDRTTFVEGRPRHVENMRRTYQEWREHALRHRRRRDHEGRLQDRRGDVEKRQKMRRLLRPEDDRQRRA